MFFFVCVFDHVDEDKTNDKVVTTIPVSAK